MCFYCIWFSCCICNSEVDWRSGRWLCIQDAWFVARTNHAYNVALRISCTLSSVLLSHYAYFKVKPIKVHDLFCKNNRLKVFTYLGSDNILQMVLNVNPLLQDPGIVLTILLIILLSRLFRIIGFCLATESTKKLKFIWLSKFKIFKRLEFNSSSEKSGVSWSTGDDWTSRTAVCFKSDLAKQAEKKVFPTPPLPVIIKSFWFLISFWGILNLIND